jgi:hypothetical protein
VYLKEDVITALTRPQRIASELTGQVIHFLLPKYPRELGDIGLGIRRDCLQPLNENSPITHSGQLLERYAGLLGGNPGVMAFIISRAIRKLIYADNSFGKAEALQAAQHDCGVQATG